MVALHEVIKEAIVSFGGVASSNEVAKYINEKYPNTWRRSSIKTCLYSCSVNNPSAYIHHASTPKFLFSHGQGIYELYDPKKHGIWSNGVKIDEPQQIQAEKVLNTYPKRDTVEINKLEVGLNEVHAVSEVKINSTEALKPIIDKVENTNSKSSFFDALKSFIAKIKFIIFLIFRI